MQDTLRKVKNFFIRPELSNEAIEAYLLYRLPEKIEVSWERDNDFIIGKVIAGTSEFVTQGTSADNFIEMVNDAIYTVCNIPLDYIDEIKKYKTFNPSEEERQRLSDLKIKGNKILININRQHLQVA